MFGEVLRAHPEGTSPENEKILVHISSFEKTSRVD